MAKEGLPLAQKGAGETEIEERLESEGRRGRRGEEGGRAESRGRWWAETTGGIWRASATPDCLLLDFSLETCARSCSRRTAHAEPPAALRLPALMQMLRDETSSTTVQVLPRV